MATDERAREKALRKSKALSAALPLRTPRFATPVRFSVLLFSKEMYSTNCHDLLTYAEFRTFIKEDIPLTLN